MKNLDKIPDLSQITEFKCGYSYFKKDSSMEAVFVKIFGNISLIVFTSGKCIYSKDEVNWGNKTIIIQNEKLETYMFTNSEWASISKVGINNEKD